MTAVWARWFSRCYWPWFSAMPATRQMVLGLAKGSSKFAAGPSKNAKSWLLAIRTSGGDATIEDAATEFEESLSAKLFQLKNSLGASPAAAAKVNPKIPWSRWPIAGIICWFQAACKRVAIAGVVMSLDEPATAAVSGPSSFRYEADLAHLAGPDLFRSPHPLDLKLSMRKWRRAPPTLPRTSGASPCT